MHPFFIFIIVGAALRFSSVNGIDAEDRAAYDRIVECLSIGIRKHPPGEMAKLPFETVICDIFKVLDECFTKPFDSASHSREILDFFRAYQLQRIILIRKSNMCKEPLPYQKLKELVIESGIMEKENLPSIENDTYVACAGEVSRKCYSEEVSVRKHHADLLRVFFKFTDCYDEETKKCDAPIARHINTVIQAFKKHLQEKHGLFGKMIEGIKD